MRPFRTNDYHSHLPFLNTEGADLRLALVSRLKLVHE
jgi:hypothetical protein